MSLLDEMKLSYKQGTYLIKLIYLNISIFVLVSLVKVFFFLSGSTSPDIFSWFGIPSFPNELLTKPWTLFTYMFFHKDIWHVLINVLWLYTFGRIFLQYLNQKQLLSVYLVGGIIGGLLYFLAFNIFPVFQGMSFPSHLIGASAGVAAIVGAAAMYAPNHELHLIFIGPVKIKFIAAIAIVMFLIGLGGTNSGGDFSHLGGALWGVVYIAQYKKGHNLTAGFDIFLGKVFAWFKPKKNLHVKHKKQRAQTDYEYNSTKRQDQDRVNDILDKIAQSGYDSLSKEEKDILFKMGNKK